MTKWHAHVIHMAKHMDMVGTLGPRPLNPALAWLFKFIWNSILFHIRRFSFVCCKHCTGKSCCFFMVSFLVYKASKVCNLFQPHWYYI